MATFAELSARINDVFRDFVINGVPASGGWEPRKLEIRAIINEIVAAIAAGSFAEPPNWASTLASILSRLETLDVIVDQAAASADQARDARDGALAIYGSIAAVQGAVAQAEAALAEMLDFAEGAPEAASIISKLNRDGGNADDAILEALPFIHPKTDSVARSVRERLSEIVSVKDFGAVGDGITRDDLAFGKALLGGNVHVYVPEGTYLFKDIVRLYANTTLTMHPAAVILDDVVNQAAPINGNYCFVNGELRNDSYATGYDGDGNITITGGTFDHSLRAAKSELTTSMAFAHARGITLEGITFRNGFSSHYLEINSSQHVRIRRCRFLDHASGGSYNREDINIDYAFADGLNNIFGSYDDTPCDDVVIEDCFHSNSVLGTVGVGTHSIPPSPIFHTNIHIRRCVYQNLDEIGVTASGWKHASIEDCTFTNTGDAFVRVRASEDVRVVGNTARGLAQRTSGAALFFDGVSDCLARDNHISNVGYTQNYRTGVDINAPSTNNAIYTRGIAPGSETTAIPGEGVWESETDQVTGTRVNGAQYVNMADDTVRAIPFEAPEHQGFVSISTSSGLSPRVTGLIWARAKTASGAPLLCEPVSVIADANVVYTTGVVTVGGSADGKITVSAAADGNLYIVNRSGTFRRFFLDFQGGQR